MFSLLFQFFVSHSQCKYYPPTQGPPITTTTMVSAKSLIANTSSANDKNIMATGPFVLRTPLLTTYAQQLWLIAQTETDNHDDEKFDKTFQINVMIEGITKEHKPVPLSNVIRNRYCIAHFFTSISFLFCIPIKMIIIFISCKQYEAFAVRTKLLRWIHNCSFGFSGICSLHHHRTILWPGEFSSTI